MERLSWPNVSLTEYAKFVVELSVRLNDVLVFTGRLNHLVVVEMHQRLGSEQPIIVYVVVVMIILNRRDQRFVILARLSVDIAEIKQRQFRAQDVIGMVRIDLVRGILKRVLFSLLRVSPDVLPCRPCGE